MDTECWSLQLANFIEMNLCFGPHTKRLQAAIIAIPILALAWSTLWTLLYVLSITLGSLVTLVWYRDERLMDLIWPWTFRTALLAHQRPRTFEQWWRFLGHMTYLEGARWVKIIRRGFVVVTVLMACLGIYAIMLFHPEQPPFAWGALMCALALVLFASIVIMDTLIQWLLRTSLFAPKEE